MIDSGPGPRCRGSVCTNKPRKLCVLMFQLTRRRKSNLRSARTNPKKKWAPSDAIEHTMRPRGNNKLPGFLFSYLGTVTPHRCHATDSGQLTLAM